jgi:ABC-type Fe3+/spermidine/putrescine transport system ATPase subunit
VIRLTDLVYTVGTFRLEVSLDIEDEDYFVILGATGSGKTATVECLCGLRQPQSGRIEIMGRDVTGMAPRHRSIGYVPQDYALFTHHTVSQNIAFGPVVQGWPREKIREAVSEAARLVGIGHLLGRRVPGLSGGERQRVALARALAVRPAVLILDEPVSALDESARGAVCQELLRIHREFRIPVIHVCHSSEETRLVATRAAIIRGGRIVQTAPPDDLFERPLNPYVAQFLRLDNVFSGTGIRATGRSCIRANGVDIAIDAPEGPVDFIVRPWQVEVTDSSSGTARTDANAIEGSVSAFTYAGPTTRIQLSGPLPIVAQIARRDADRLSLAVGKKVRMSFPTEAVHVMKQGKEAVCSKV